MVAGRLLTARVMRLAVAASAISRAAGTRVLANHSDENMSLHESMWSSAAVGPVNCVPGGVQMCPGGVKCPSCGKPTCQCPGITANCTSMKTRSPCTVSGCSWCAVTPWGEGDGVCFDSETHSCCGNSYDCTINDVKLCENNVTQCCESSRGCEMAGRPECIPVKSTCCGGFHYALGCNATEECCGGGQVYPVCCGKEAQCCIGTGSPADIYCCHAKEKCGKSNNCVASGPW